MRSSSESASGHGDRLVYQSERERLAAGSFGMLLFLASVVMLFGATILGLLAIRLDASTWPENLPGLPTVVWTSTFILCLSSVTMQWAVVASRNGRSVSTRWAIGLTVLLGLGFLYFQTLAWIEWNDAIRIMVDEAQAAQLALTGFHVLTAVHAAHVIGGLIPLAVIAWAVFFIGWRSDRSRGIHYTAMYWHCLDAIWIALVITLVVIL
ncbi:MAG: cytochrome c oxidase subunit 3 [Phycisphaerales bacterium]|nr:cytochrome c oxidase subunit 3 [Phycisphaerales bacterium]|tara:strand:- start:1574 stop:2200 length:627 start_codon:yes stop_codon:yes gene_type:complete